MSERFDDEGLRQAYAPRLRRPAAHGPECPAPDALLAAVRGEGPEAERLRVLDHALSCAACRPELALLHTVSGGASTTRPVATLPNRWRRLAPLALAASVLIAVGIFGAERFLNRNAPEPTRSAGGDAPVLAAPADRAALSDGTVGFAWHPMPGALRYTLEVDAADGSVLFTGTTADTVLAARLDTVPRGEHRWSVRARLDDGGERRSGLRRLRLR